MPKPTNLLDMMSKADRDKMLARYHERTAQNGQKNKISSEMYILAEFGMMFGWDAIMAVRNNEITGEEMFAIYEAGKKVQAVNALDDKRGTSTAISATFSKHGKSVFAEGMHKEIERGNS